MNLKMNLKNFIKCSIWINDITHAEKVSIQNIIKRSIEVNVLKSMDNIRIQIELALPRNTSNYAFIGFEYIPNKVERNKLTVSVYLNDELKLYNNKSLAKIGDKVFMGISSEYGESILESAIDYINNIGGFPAGEIIFNIGAHAECGSSKDIFKKVTKLLLEISQFDLENMTNELIQEKIGIILDKV